MTPVTAEQRARLPKWAQHELRRLESNVENLRARIAQGPEDSDTFADPYSVPPRPLGAQPTIEFVLPYTLNGRPVRVQAEIRAEALHIRSTDGALHVQPGSSNTLAVWPARHR